MGSKNDDAINNISGNINSSHHMVLLFVVFICVGIIVTCIILRPPQASKEPPPPPPAAAAAASSSSSCIGSSTILLTSKGLLPLKDICIGDKILSWNPIHNCSVMRPVYYIHKHGDNLVLHHEYVIKNISTNQEDIVVLTPNHLIFMPDKTYEQAKNLDIGDSIMNLQNDTYIITRICQVYDLPLTPTVDDGTIVLPNNNVISCWTHNQETAEKINYGLQLLKPSFKMLNTQEISDMIERAYKYFTDENKDLSKCNDILKTLKMSVNKPIF